MDSLLNDAPCGFFAFTDDGSVVDVNRTLAGMLGYTPGQIAGGHVERLLPAGGRIFYHTYLLPLLKMQGMVEEIYVALRTRDGDEVPVLLNGARTERGGRTVNECVCLRMIRRNEYEDQLLQARRLAEESSAAKAKFLSMMSHDLRAPLTTIYGNAQLLALDAGGRLSAEQRAALETIITACRLQMTMMTDILEFARAESRHIQVRLQPVSARHALARAEELMRVPAADAGLRLEVRECPSDVVVTADPDRLQQILLNLLTNAVKFTPSGGGITVWCEGGAQAARIHVQDTGIGIAREQLQRVFAPFVQVEATTARAAGGLPSGGVGLGLAISRELAQAMGGDITAESAPGEGSRFTIALPAASLPRETAPAA